MSRQNIEDIYPLSPSQQGMLFHLLFSERKGQVYFDQYVATFAGALDLPAMRAAWAATLERHAVLRIQFLWERREQPLQVVRRDAVLPWTELDLRGLPEDERDAKVAAFLRADHDLGFDLGKPPLTRIAILRLRDDLYRFVWSFHHLVVDGWSMGLILADAFGHYAALSAGREYQAARPRPFRDYITWIQTQDAGSAESFWRRTLGGFSAATPLPYDGTGAGGDPQGWVSRETIVRIDAPLTDGLRALARRHLVTLNTVLQGAWSLLLGLSTDRSDVVFGGIVSGRPPELEGVEAMVGMFINLLPVRVGLERGMEVGRWLKEIQEQQIEQREYEHNPLGDILGWSEVGRQAPLFETVLVFENYPLDSLSKNTSELALDVREVHLSESGNFPLTLYIMPLRSEIELRFNYHWTRVGGEGAGRLLEHLLHLLHQLAERPEARLGDFTLLTLEERRQLLAGARGPAQAGAEAAVHVLFEEAARRTPEAPALEAADGATLTYGELAARSGSLARHLRTLGVGPESIVGLCLERSPAMIVGMLGVLQAGGAYLPLDPAYPAERLALMLEDSGARLVLSEEHSASALPESAPRLLLDAEWEGIEMSARTARAQDPSPLPAVDPRHPAYVIYTSGSTGRPKGVMVSHAALVNYVRHAVASNELSAADRVLQFASMSFDTSAEEIYPCFACGATLVLRDAEMLSSGARFLGELERLRISILDLPTAYWHELVGEMEALDRGVPAALRLVILGGEEAQRDRLESWRARVGAGVRLLNTYGPTEATIVSTQREVGGEPPAGSVPIGRPVANAQAYLLDRDLDLVPAGMVGELYLGGAGLARGYLGRPDLTAERFLPDPFAGVGSAGGRLYRSGDLARLTPEGDLEFRGRADDQVKIRGFRIELGEIEAALRRQPRIREAVVVARGEAGGGKRVVAYLVPEGDAAPTAGELRQALKAELPDYMVPALFVTLAELPLTPSRKVDRRALPEPEAAGSDREAEDPGSRNPVEELLAGIWSDLLGAPRVQPHDDFFELGGHSLLATRMISRVRVVFAADLPLRAVFDEPTLAGLARRIERTREGDAGTGLPPLVPAARGGALPTSFAQQRLWFLDRLEPGSFANNLASAVRLEGDLNVAAMAGAVDALVRRHESLRTTFAEEEGEPRQVIAAPAPAPLPVVDLSGLGAEARQAESRRIATGEARRPYDLARGPLLRFTLLRLAERNHGLLFGTHHIVSDGWSMGLLVRELGGFYRAFAAGEPAPFADPALQYADYAVWQRQWMTGEVLAERVAWWSRQLAGAPPVIELPLDRPRPANQSYRGGRVPLTIDSDVWEGLQGTARRLGVTPFMILLAGFSALLHRHGSQDDVVVGTPIANRGRAELEELIGFFANTLALRVDLSGDPTFEDLARRVREVALGAYAHQDVPFERLVTELKPERDLSVAPVFQVTLAVQNLPPSSLNLGGLALLPLEFEAGRTQFDLSLFLIPWPDGRLYARLEHATDIVDSSTAVRLLVHLGELLRGVAETPRLPLSELPLLTAAERGMVLREWNDTARPRGTAPLVHRQVAEQARLRPAGLAVALGERRLTYGELEARSNRLAHFLRSLGVGPEVLVGVCAERSPERAVGIVAVLKAGGAYVSLDPSYPAERLAFLVEDSRARVVLTESRFLDRLPENVASTATVLCLDRDLERRSGDESPPPELDLGPESLAYVVYTSGSTGRPKGVAIPHRGLLNLVEWHRAAYGLAPEDRGTLVAGTAFDASVWELWPLLAAGASAHIPDEETRLSAPRLLAWWGEEGITQSFLPTPLAEALLEEPLLDEENPALDLQMRDVLIGGDRLHRAPRPGTPFRLVNHYGPSEYSVVTTAGAVPAAPRATAAGSPPPIGRPIDNTRIYVLDRRLGPVGTGIPGELHVAGAGLARGYLGRPDLTAERFLPDPFALDEAGARMYRTGDLVRWLSDGSLDFLGRIDHQVKVRGMRVELGEIETVLAARPDLREAAVLVREDRPGDRRLAAYVVGEAGIAPSVETLRRDLERELPAYMVPQDWVVLDALPLSPNGKVDRAALPAPGLPGAKDGEDAGALNPLEELLGGIWSDLMGVGSPGPRDDFFALGGHSLLATRMMSRIRVVFGLDLPVRSVFEEPTLAGLAGRIAEALARDAGQEIPPLVPVPRGGSEPTSFSQQRLWFLDQLEPGSLAHNLPGGVRLAGELDVPALWGALTAILGRHESLRTSFGFEDGEPRQVIAPPARAPLPLVDLSALPAAEREEAARGITADEARRPFDLARGPLMRFALLRLDARDHALLACTHHIVSDGWSMGIFVRELGALYRAFAGGAAPALPPLPVQYADYANWQRRWMTGAVLDETLAWWERELGGAPQVIELPLDRPRAAVQSYRGGAATRKLGAELGLGLQAASRKLGITPFMLFLGGFAGLLNRYGSQDDVVIGTPIANRGRAELEDLIGFFANTLALRVDLAGDPTTEELARQVRERALGAYAHQDVPFERLVDRVAPERDLGVSPVFQVLLALQNLPASALDLAGLALSPLPFETGPSQFDLSLYLTPWKDGSLSAYLEYAADLFDADTADRLLRHFEQLLRGVAETPRLRLSELPLLAPEERLAILAAGNQTAVEIRPELLPQLFEAAAAARPSAPAVVFGAEALTYAELNARANRLAHHLLGRGAGPETRITVCVERSPDLVVALLAVLKSGAAYVPLDPAYPEDRIAWVVEDSRSALLLTQSHLAPSLPAGTAPVLALDRLALEQESAENPAPRALAEGLAYVIYTSGSTGRPKGVAVRHDGVVNFLASMARSPGLAADDALLAVTTVSFDIAVLELFLPLALGARVELADPETAADGLRLLERLEASAATAMQATPATWRMLLEAGWRGSPGLKVLCGGEALPPDLARELLARSGELWNVYGPTETTVWSAVRRVSPADAEGPRPLPLGEAIANTEVHVLSRFEAGLQPMPPGAPGELYIGGSGLARGYLGRPDLTAERFVADPFAPAPGGRLYRTGDLARRRPYDGALEFLGRADHQVKIRGFRIELGEIEAVLGAQPAIRECAVVVREDGPGVKRLAAYVSLHQGAAADPEGWLRAVGATLPEYMVPQLVAVRAALPLTPNGKVDRRALLALPAEGAGAEAVAPRNPVEEILAGVWAEVLHLERVGVTDSFFRLGGDSILVIQAATRSRARGVRFTPRQLFQNQTIAQLAEIAELAGPETAAAPEPKAPAAAAAPGAFSPSSFPEADLSQAELDELLSVISES